MSARRIFDRYLDFVREAHVRHPLNETRFGHFLHTQAPGLVKRRARVGGAALMNVYDFPSLTKCAFEKRLGHKINWPPEPGDWSEGEYTLAVEEFEPPAHAPQMKKISEWLN